ncbi:class I SAM-dependent methyltransferase [Longispora sp. K20-0274]|uniref:class I SAM-dependent methyltransferase n=1 Tax=Longispora sp. K20-0274 TaxID=3088255 RepID=UPI003999AF58
MTAIYDPHAAWYDEYVTDSPYMAMVDGVLAELLGRGHGTVLEIGCGTGAHAAALRSTGRTPVGVDISAGQLSFAAGKLPVARADAGRLPVASGSLDAVASVLIHTDVPDYRAAVREAARVLRPGGVLAHVGVHPCFTGAFSDRSDPDRVIITSELYGHTGVSFHAWTSEGVRARVGARHLPVSDLVNAFLDAGLTVDRLTERGMGPLPDVLGISARKA